MSLIACPECGKQVSKAAPTCPGCGVPIAKKAKKASSTSSSGCAMALLVVLGLGALGSIVEQCSGGPSAPASPATSSTGVGEDVTLVVASGEIPVAPSKEAYDRVFDLLIANDFLGVGQMEAAGQIFTVKSGTRAKVIGRAFEAREVRIMSGPETGRSGWVSTSLVQ